MKRVVCMNVMQPGMLHMSDYFKQFYERFCGEQKGWKILGKIDVVSLIEERCRNGKKSIHYVLEQDARAQEFNVLLICSAKQISRSSEMVGSYVRWFAECGVEVWSICEGRLSDIFSLSAKVIPLMEFVNMEERYGEYYGFSESDEPEFLDGYVIAGDGEAETPKVMERILIRGKCLGGRCRRCKCCSER